MTDPLAQPHREETDGQECLEAALNNYPPPSRNSAGLYNWNREKLERVERLEEVERLENMKKLEKMGQRR